jgi:cytochrome c peroxidase
MGVPFAADGLTLGLRNTPTAMYASFTPAFSVAVDGTKVSAYGGQFLDGREASLEDQARVPFFSAGEMNLASVAELSARLADAPYAALMLEEFGPGLFSSPAIVLDSAVRAIAAFERTPAFAPFSSKFDNVRVGAAVLTDLEKEGLQLFDDPEKGNCAECHFYKPAPRNASEFLFTDFSYQNIWVPRNSRIPANADPLFFDLGLCGPKRARVADDRLCASWKVPTLRNVSRRQAYMHNGVFTDLREVVAFHVTRHTTPYRWYPFGGNFPNDQPGFLVRFLLPLTVPFAPLPGGAPRLDEHEIDAVTAFLRTLDDGYGPSRIPGAL